MAEIRFYETIYGLPDCWDLWIVNRFVYIVYMLSIYYIYHKCLTVDFFIFTC